MAILAAAAIRGSAQRSWALLGAFFAGSALGAAPFVVYLAVRGAFGAFVETSFVAIPRIIDAVWSLPFPDLTTTFRKNLNLHTLADFVLNEQFRFILNPLVIGIALIVLVQRRITRRSDAFDLSLAVLTAFAILTQRSALGRADFPHQYFSAFLIGPMILILLVLLGRATARVWRTRDRAAQAFVTLAAAIVVPLLAVMLWVPDIANLRLDDTTHYLGRVSRIGWIDPAAEEIRNRVDAIKSVVDALSKPGQPIFDFSNQPALYFFCDRPNPTRFYQVPILSPRDYQIETIRALERARPPLVIRHSPQEFDVFDGIDNSIRAQAVAAYIDDHYTYARSTRGVEIWRRRAEESPLNLAAYVSRIRIPSLEELGAIGERSRVVFPSVGSLPGANATYWRSDLTLHNPFKERMALGLRYVFGRCSHRPGRHDPRRTESAMGRRRPLALPRARGKRRALDRIPRPAPAGCTDQDLRRRAQRAGLGRRAALDARLRQRRKRESGPDDCRHPRRYRAARQHRHRQCRKNPRHVSHHGPDAHRPADRTNVRRRSRRRRVEDGRGDREDAWRGGR